MRYPFPPIASVSATVERVVWIEQGSGFQGYLINGLSQDLQIVKIRSRYTCSKQRVDAMDFKLWFFRDQPEYEV